jgi:hypothetical protein
MARLRLWIFVVSFMVPAMVSAQFAAEQVTAGNAATDLFGGTDADGGIGDWYLTNGVVEVIIDDVGPQADLVPLLGANTPPRASEAAFTGGSILDLGRAGGDNDQLGQMFTVGGLSTSNFVLYDTISATAGTSSATITASGTLLGFDSGATPVPPGNLPVVTDYTLNGSDPYLTVTSTVTNTHPTNPAAGLGGFIDVFIWVTRGIVPFSPLLNRGFNHTELDLNNIAFSVEFPAYSAGPGNVYPTDGMIDPNTGAVCGEVSYGLLGDELSIDPDGPGGTPATISTVNTLLGVSSNLITAFGNFPSGNLDPGEVLTYTRRLYVGDRNDVASVANDIIPVLAARQGFSTGTVSGDIDATDTANVTASVIVTRTGGAVVPGFAAGAPVTHFRTDSSGSFSGVVLPVGTYDLEFQSVNRGTVTVSGVAVTAGGDTAVSPGPLLGLGTLNVTVLERRSPEPDQTIPAKLTFIGIDGTPNPNFRHDFDALSIPQVGSPQSIRPETFAGGPGQGNFYYLADGTGSIQIPPGKYEIFASRGLEYGVVRRKVRIKEGTTRKRKFKIRRIVDTDDYLSADFHIHSARSFDTSSTLLDRVAAFGGEGVEVMISTEHDFHVDYGPVISALNLGDLMTSIVGNEVTTSTPNPPMFPDAIGHINAWPLTVQPDAPRDGAIEDEFVAPNVLFSRLRNQGVEVIQYNHVRAGVSGLTSIGFFNNFGYDPDLPITSPPNDLLLDDDLLGPGISGVSNPDGIRNIDFDVMEIGNGTGINGYLALRRDWFSLLNQMDLVTVPFIGGTGVSDSHRVTVESAGYFRTYVGRVGDVPSALNVTDFNNNIKAGNMMATTGPYIEFFVEELAGGRAGLGQTLAPSTSDVTLSIRVLAANWIPVDEVRVYANGFLAASFDATTSPKVQPAPNNPRSQSTQRTRRFEAEVPLSLSVDTWFVVEAGPKLTPPPTPPPFVDMIVPGNEPIGFTNPIFVDLAGDGFDPPGLPVMASATGAGEATPRFARVKRLDSSMWARVGQWWDSALASARTWGSAEAHEEQPPLTGKELQAEVERQKNQASDDYFPLYRFSIPPESIDQAIEQLPEPQRSRIREERRNVR